MKIPMQMKELLKDQIQGTMGFTIYFAKYNNVATLTIVNDSTNLASGTTYTIATLPEELRPLTGVYLIGTNANHKASGNISASGEVKVVQDSGAPQHYLSYSITYITK